MQRSLQVGTFFLAAITFYIEIIKPWRNKPKLEIRFQRRDNQFPYVHVRDVIKTETGETERRDLPGGRKEYLKARQLELDVKNEGRTPACNCEAKCRVWKDGKIQRVEPLLLYWSRKLPYDWLKAGEPEPVTINKNNFEELRFLRLKFWSEYGTEELWQKHGVEVKDLSIEGFRLYNIKRGHEYIVEITISSENADPVSKRFRIRWNGSFYFEKCVEEG